MQSPAHSRWTVEFTSIFSWVFLFCNNFSISEYGFCAPYSKNYRSTVVPNGLAIIFRATTIFSRKASLKPIILYCTTRNCFFETCLFESEFPLLINRNHHIPFRFITIQSFTSAVLKIREDNWVSTFNPPCHEPSEQPQLIYQRASPVRQHPNLDELFVISRAVTINSGDSSSRHVIVRVTTRGRRVEN